MIRPLVALVVACLAAGPAFAERLVTSISTSRVMITSSYSGAELVLFGSIERDAATVSRPGGYDVVVAVRGPATGLVVREKDRVGPIWVNVRQRKYADVPGYLALIGSRPLAEMLDAGQRSRWRLGFHESLLAQGERLAVGDPEDVRFREGLIRLKRGANLYKEADRGTVFLTKNLFRTAISLPATAPLGSYEATVFVFADGAMLVQQTTAFEAVKVGFEAATAGAAHRHGFLYGLVCVLLAAAFGWVAHWAFRKD
jgi:uncharacterized protein (TIGR02186 family)